MQSDGCNVYLLADVCECGHRLGGVRAVAFRNRLSLNSVGEITDAPWGVYADGVG